jgi:formylglycine-generating enzyme required for sulfatase activity
MRLRVPLALFYVLFAAFAAFSAEIKTHTNSIGMEFVLIPAGSVLRGIVVNELHERLYKAEVIISKPFYLGKYLVTQGQWAAVMGNNPARFNARNNPVETVSWNEVHEFIRRLNAKEKHNGYRLPTEAEWELAASGGTGSIFFFLNNQKTWEEAVEALDAYAWFKHNSGGATHPVGQKKPNPFSLYDVYGNVWEWVQDWFEDLPTDQENTDFRSPATVLFKHNADGAQQPVNPEKPNQFGLYDIDGDVWEWVQELSGALPTDRELTDYRGPITGSRRVLRGGSGDHDNRTSHTYRYGITPGYQSSYIGFRLALSLEKP